MKDLGFTKNGGRIVEMSETEYVHFARLCVAIENKPVDQIFTLSPHDMYFRDGYDFSNTFEVIRAFFDARFRVTDLQKQIDAIRESLNK